jgi:D-aminoacyl-tRNA deacylase
MIALIQRVRSAHVEVAGRRVGAIDRGVLALIGVEGTDQSVTGPKMLERLLSYRIFPDDAGKMNLDVRQINGGLLLVPQFTLVADTSKGTRPSFSSGASPEAARGCSRPCSEPPVRRIPTWRPAYSGPTCRYISSMTGP